MGEGQEREKGLIEPMAECTACLRRFPVSASKAEGGDDECPYCGEKRLVYDLGGDEGTDSTKTPGEG